MTAGLDSMPPLAPTGPTTRSHGLSGQGLLLTLGGLLLLSGASVFVVVVWLLVGVYGQALLMAAATIAAAGIAYALGRRGLGAGAEAFAVVACGLLVLDLWGAHHLGFAGLDDASGPWYAAAAAVLGAACAALADRLTRPRRIVYAPFAALLAVLAPWFVVAALDLARASLVASFGVAFVIDLLVLAGVAGVERTDRLRSPAVIVAGGVTALGLLAFVCADLGLGYDTGLSRSVHLEAAALALVVPALVVLATVLRFPERVGITAPVRSPAPWVVTSFLAAALGMVVFDAPIGVLVAVAIVLAGLVVAGAVRSVHATVGVLAGVAAVAQGVLAFWVAVDHEGLWAGSSAPVHALPALLWAIAAIVRTVTDRRVVWICAAEIAVALTVARGLADTSTSTGVIVSCCVLVANGVLAGLAARQPRSDPARSSLAAHTEVTAVLAGAGWAVAAIGLSLTLSDKTWTAVVLWVIGLVALAHATAPRRLPFAYLAVASVALGIWVLLVIHEVGAIEAYSLPLAAMLALVGLVHVRRGAHVSTMLTAGPALAVAIVPSLVVGVGTGSASRIAVVTLAGAVALVAGLQARWLAPVVVGTLTLVVIALSQGGPLLAYVPGWLILTVVGALLLTIGVRWEATVTAGRRAGVWVGSLR